MHLISGIRRAYDKKTTAFSETLMKKRTLLLILLLFLYLLAFPQTAASNARDGLVLWYTSVLPVLFPFMLLCSILLQLGFTDSLPRTLVLPVRRLLHCSSHAVFAILAGFLCGFPMGAKITSQLYNQKKIGRKEAKFLYGFVNNLSPGFITSYIAVQQMQFPGHRFWMLASILGAAMLYGILSSLYFGKTDRQDALLETPPTVRLSKSGLFTLIDSCIYDSILSIVKLGGYIVVFSILSGAVMQLPLPEHPAVLFLISCIEVTNGVRLLASSSLAFPLKYLMIHALAAFGGLSAAAQTAGITAMDREMFFYYIKSRVIITLLSILFAIISLFWL